MSEYLVQRCADLRYENALLKLRCQDLLDIIEGFQRFGSIGRFDADKITNTKTSLAEMIAAEKARKQSMAIKEEAL